MKTNNIDKNIILYPYSLVATIEEVYNKAGAKVNFQIDGIDYNYRAISIEPLHHSYKSQQCLLLFNQGEISKPIITGIIQSDDNEPLVLSCEDGVVLECGDTTIELESNGTLNLQALHINSQAYGPYRIKGASVKIN